MSISLEPRLIEYLNKKSYNKKNNIISSISEEIQYYISREDISRIKAYLYGEPHYNNLEAHTHPRFYPKHNFTKIKDSRVPYKSDMTETFEPVKSNDTQFDKLTKYQKFEPIDLLPEFADRYPKFNTARSSRYTHYHKNPRSDPRMFPPKVERLSTTSTYENPKLHGMEQYFTSDPSHYARKYNHVPVGHTDHLFRKNKVYTESNYGGESTIDTYTKTVIPTIQSKSTQYNWERFGEIPMDREIRNIDLETAMVYGMPHHTEKSYGFRNPTEHYYQYIDPAIQDPRNVIFPVARGGNSTRLDNKMMGDDAHHPLHSKYNREY